MKIREALFKSFKEVTHAATWCLGMVAVSALPFSIGFTVTRENPNYWMLALHVLVIIVFATIYNAISIVFRTETKLEE